ncbi:hypothetical protein [Acinetobacter bohemicus]|uniref:hypothetical protein n=1 Tax=Acinetobacter bohemicus TaxID=1435036 RepID=UPI0040417593
MNSNWYSFFWVFGVLMFGSSISDMAMAGELNYKYIVFVIIALMAWIHGTYIKYKQKPKGLIE